MNATQEEAIRKLREQRDRFPAHSAPRMVAEQLTDICRMEPASAAILLPDLDNPEMSVARAEAKIHAYADSLHKEVRGSGVCVSVAEAEKILREFYGLPDAASGRETIPGSVTPSIININPLDFL